MRDPYSRSIFAYSLSQIIAPRDLTDLSRSPVSLEAKKVKPLVDSLTTLRRLPGLNPGEIMTIVIQLELTDDQRLQIYAALIALGVQRLLLEYLSNERAWLVAEEVRESALLWLRRQRGRDVFRRIRGLGMTDEPLPLQTEDPLELALDAYDEGIRLAALSQFAIDQDGNTTLQQARLCFESSRQTLELLPKSIRDSDDWIYWHSEVDKELQAVEDELQ